MSDPVTPEMLVPPLKPQPLTVEIEHEPFIPWLTLKCEGDTFELEHVECIAWFMERGAKDEEKVNDAINQALNFHHARFTILNPKKSAAPARHLPQL